MVKRTTIEIGEELRQAADAAEREESKRAARQLGYLDRLRNAIEPKVLASEEMWR
jgi:hypothetical protein